MLGILLIFVYLAVGIWLKRVGSLPDNFYQRLNTYVLYTALPAMILLYIPQVQLSARLLYPVSVGWIVYILAGLLFLLLQRPMGWDKATVGCLTLCCGLGNTSFIGYPVIEALYGEAGLKTAILVDQPGSFVVLSTLGIFTAIYYSQGKASVKEIGKKLFTFPPFIAFIIALVLLLAGVILPEWLTTVLSYIAKTLIPVALVSVGMQLNFQQKIEGIKELTIGLTYKLVLAPAIIFLLFLLAFKTDSLTTSVSIMEATMAPMITGAILAVQYKLRPQLANAFITVGIPLSFVTLAVWWLLIR